MITDKDVTNSEKLTNIFIDNAEKLFSAKVHDVVTFMTADNPEKPGEEFIMFSYHARAPLDNAEAVDKFLNFLTSSINYLVLAALKLMFKILPPDVQKQPSEKTVVTMLANVFTDVLEKHVTEHIEGVVDSIAKDHALVRRQALGLLIAYIFTRCIQFTLHTYDVPQEAFAKYITKFDPRNGQPDAKKSVVLFRPDGRKVDH